MHDLVVIGAGQAGLATAHAAQRRGVRPVVLEAGDAVGGSWRWYYDSLTLFSPARYSALPGRAFPGDPDRYPLRDEVRSYLRDYAAGLDADIRTGQRVIQVAHDGSGLFVSTAAGVELRARAVVGAAGGFGTPYRAPLSGLDRFIGPVLHSAQYRRPDPLQGQRVIVVGGGNSAVQIAVELAAVARVSLAVRSRVRWQPQRPLGRDIHWWLAVTGLDVAPLPKRFRLTPPVLDDGRYRAAVAAGNPDVRPLPADFDGLKVCWPDGTREVVEAVILATGYRPNLAFLAGTAALDADGRPAHRGGVSTTVAGLGYVGLEWQRSVSSATLRGVGRDAAHVLARLGVGGP
jgi:putative flavoprotein involved in K+ transport